MYNGMLLEHVSCDLCGGGKYKTRYRKPDAWLRLSQFEYPVVECIDCGLVYVNPRPSQESMGAFYPAGYHSGRDNLESVARYKRQAEFLPPLSKEKVLDIGCARGDFLSFLKKTSPVINACGVDYFSEGVNSDEIDFKRCSLPDAGYGDGEFDLITAWAVFEHLHRPSQYFEEVSRILKVGGSFIFLVTNSESLYGKKAFVEDIPRHIYHFSEKTLEIYAKKFGFEVRRCFYDDTIFDGRGLGTFTYTLPSLFGLTWEKILLDDVGFIHRRLRKIGHILDKLVFMTHWEAKLKMSGIMIVEFIKL